MQLEGRRDHYVPGDTISGTVERKLPLVAQNARITVALHGRSKTTVGVPDDIGAISMDGNFHDKFNFFAPDSTTQVLFDGPLHIEEGGDRAAWPFVFTIPRSMDPAAAREQLSDRTNSRMTLHEEDLRLPASFSFSSYDWPIEIEAYVEYYLEAMLRTYSKGEVKHSRAILPLVMCLPPDPRPPRADFGLRPQLTLSHYKFVSHRLIPGQEDAKLSSSQKVQRFFHSKSIPCLTVKYETEAPGVIQLEHPIPVPLLFRAVPDWDQTSDAICNVPQRIRLEWVSLKMTTEITASSGNFLYDKAANGTQTTDLGGWKSSESREAVYLPFTSKDPPLDIGALVGLRIGYSGQVGRYLNYLYDNNRLSPAFKSANIDHRGHSLSWCIRVSVAGESHQVHGAKRVRLLRPSCDSWPGGRSVHEAPPPAVETRRTESWAKPPPEKEEAPPPYDPSNVGSG